MQRTARQAGPQGNGLQLIVWMMRLSRGHIGRLGSLRTHDSGYGRQAGQHYTGQVRRDGPPLGCVDIGVMQAQSTRA